MTLSYNVVKILKKYISPPTTTREYYLTCRLSPQVKRKPFLQLAAMTQMFHFLPWMREQSTSSDSIDSGKSTFLTFNQQGKRKEKKANPTGTEDPHFPLVPSGSLALEARANRGEQQQESLCQKRHNFTQKLLMMPLPPNK